jgi:hypothetical protein
MSSSRPANQVEGRTLSRGGSADLAWVGQLRGVEVKAGTMQDVDGAWPGQGRGGVVAAAWVGRRRQVALLFLNRRAQLKTKQLEKQYDALMCELDAVMADNNGLISYKRCRSWYLSLSSSLSSISPLLLSTSIDSS